MTSNTVGRAMWAVALGVGWLTTATVAAQHGNQGAAPSGSGQTAAGGMKDMQGMQGMQGMACMGGAAQMRTLVDGLSAEVEKARQANDPAAMRTALESVQAGLTKIREHMAGCAANMSKMSGAAPAGGGGDHSAHGAAPSASAPPADHAGHDASAPTAQSIQPAQANAAEPKAAWTITITPTGYEPADILLKSGVKATLTFIRTTESTCATEVVFPDFDIEKPLPLNQPVVIEITPTKTGEFRFTCGMNMYDGKMVVK